MRKKKVLSHTAEWTFDLLQLYEKHIAQVATSYHLETYPVQLEIVSAAQMMDLYSAVGMPLGYHHWSFGKQFLNIEKTYRRGAMGLAYEIVINSDPCIAYLLEENTLSMQALVMAHACYGHNSFFKGNYLFHTWTNPETIIDYLVFAKNYVAECEEKYGIDAVEELIDACHAVMNYGVDRYKHPAKLSLKEEELRQKQREEYLQSQINDLWRTFVKPNDHSDRKIQQHFPSEPQENILYFIEKHAPNLELWQREIVRIIRKIAQYFYPQRQTKIMNEGWATFWHYIIINDLYDRGLLSDEFMLEFLQNHTSVLYQPPFDSKYYSGINPYTLGFSIFSEIRRICENPTEEDKLWFPSLVHTDWLKQVDFAMRNFKDESFIAQYLSPKLIRDLKLFVVHDDDRSSDLVITAIHDEAGYQHIRTTLSDHFNLSNSEPNLQVYHVDKRGDRSLTLRHIQYNRRPLNQDVGEVLRHLHQLWGFKVRLESVDEEGKIQHVYAYP